MAKVLWIVLGVVVLWFVPWVWSFYFGLVVYFPYQPDGKARFVRTTGPLLSFKDDSNWVSEENIPKSCKRALVAAEDTRFYQHFGVDPKSVELALERNRKLGKRRWGASTITQQLVKNVFLSRKKTYLRKAREMTGAVILDAIMSKDRQIVWYLNVVEFGPSVYGLKAASQFYYRKTPQKLSNAECIALISLLPSPNRSSKFVKNNAASPFLKKRVDHIKRTMATMGANGDYAPGSWQRK